MKNYLLLFLSLYSFAQQAPTVDFIKLQAQITLNTSEKKVFGSAEYLFKVLQSTDTIRIDAKNMTFDEVKINNKTVHFKNNNKELLLYEGFNKGSNSLQFSYQATPKQTLYFIGEDDDLQIWTQGQGKYTSHWLPSFDDVNEKVIFNISITFRNDFEVIANGVLKDKVINSKGSHYTWKYQMQKPMSSYLVAIAIGKFDKNQHISASGIPLMNYYKPADIEKYNYTYAHSDAIFNFLENEIGVRYPWQIYKQVPISDFIYAGMENTSLTLFAQDYVVDEAGFNDGNYCNINAHELAHQWFGNLVTAKTSKHHWLQEGFATYYALLAEREFFGEDYFYYQLYKNAQQLKNASKTDTIPLMNEKASSLTFYQKGAWALHSIREKIGEKTFKKAVKKYLKKHQYKNVETNDFLIEIQKVSRFDVEKFRKTWLESAVFANEETMNLLTKNNFIKKLLEIQSYRNKPFSEKKMLFESTMKSNVYYPVKVEILNQVKNIPFDDKSTIIQLAMQTQDINVRQAVAQTTSVIPIRFKPEYETLLQDKSYDTQAIALEKLCANFPNECSLFLTKIQESSKKNEMLRSLYLQYALTNETLNTEIKSSYYKELIAFTSVKFNSNTRQNALQILSEINPSDTVFLYNLINATTHYKWRFSQYARQLLKEVLKNEKVKNVVLEIDNLLNDNERSQLKKLL